jgi:hypothetical protein
MYSLGLWVYRWAAEDHMQKARATWGSAYRETNRQTLAEQKKGLYRSRLSKGTPPVGNLDLKVPFKSRLIDISLSVEVNFCQWNLIYTYLLFA